MFFFQQIILLSLIQIDQFHIHSPPWLPMKTTSQNNDKYSQYIENNGNCQTFVYNADEISLEALLDPNFRPMPIVEQQQQQQRQPSQVYYEIYQRPQRPSSTTKQANYYSRASFDPFSDLTRIQPFATMPTRRRNPVLNNVSVIHL